MDDEEDDEDDDDDDDSEEEEDHKGRLAAFYNVSQSPSFACDTTSSMLMTPE